MKICTKCNEAKSLDEYYKSNKTKDGRRERCKSCISEQTRQWREDNKEYTLDYAKEYRKNNAEKVKASGRKSSLKYKYGITHEQYGQMLVKQDGVCAICRNTNENGWALSVDHDHSCCPGKRSCGECVRSLLCNSCNAMLGHAKESQATLKAAITYLESFADVNRK